MSSNLIYYSSVGVNKILHLGGKCPRLLLLETGTTTTSGTGALLQAWEEGGGEERGTHAVEMLTLDFSFLFLHLLAIGLKQLEWT